MMEGRECVWEREGGGGGGREREREGEREGERGIAQAALLESVDKIRR